nr:hypothetical protein [Fischerella sp. PCC 9605]
MSDCSEKVIYQLKIVLLGISPMRKAAHTCQKRHHNRRFALHDPAGNGVGGHSPAPFHHSR